MRNRVNIIVNKYSKLVALCCSFCESPAIASISILIYKIFLDGIYLFCIANRYAFFDVVFSGYNTINGYLMVFLTSFFMNAFYKQETPGAVIIIAIYLIYFIPITTYCAFGGGSGSFLFYASIYWVVLFSLQITVPTIKFKIQTRTMSNKIFYVVIIVVSVLHLYIWYRYTGCRMLTSIIDVYNVRAQTSRDGIPILLSYIRSISTIAVPMMILMALYKKKYISLLWLLFITYISFCYGGNKTIILFPMVLAVGYILYRSRMISLICPVAIMIQIIGIVGEVIGKGFIINLLFRRQCMMLAQISEMYYRFFSNYPTDNFRNSIMGKFGYESIYSIPIPNVIGNNFETQTVSCNNGMLADVWSNLGVFGIVIMPIILIVCFRLFDFVASGVDSRITIGLVLYYAIIFCNASWSTTLLTHGYLLMCFMLLLFPKKKEVTNGNIEFNRSIRQYNN